VQIAGTDEKPDFGIGLLKNTDNRPAK